MAFQKACRAEGVAPLLGVEADWVYDMAVTRTLKYPHNRSHICLIAENNTGLSNIWSLASLAYTDKYRYYKPLLTTELMREYSEGIWASDGCFAGTERYLTLEGTKSFIDTVGTIQMVLGGDANWTAAEIKSFGMQQLLRLRVSRYGIEREILTTANHRWFTAGHRFPSGTLRKSPRLDEKLTSDLSVGDTLRTTFSRKYTARVAWVPTAVQAGIVFGDGTIDRRGTRRSSRVKLYGAKDAQLLKLFPLNLTTHCATEDAIEVRGLPGYFKDAPSLTDSSLSYLYWWLAGYFAADGCVNKSGTSVLSSATRENLQLAQDVCQLLGIRTGFIYESVASKTVPQGAHYEDVRQFYLTVNARDVQPDFFLIEEHRQRVERAMDRPEKTWADWTVIAIEETDRLEEVFCAVVPHGHAFTLEGNVLTGNCMITEFGRAVDCDDYDLARQHFSALLDIFGDHFYSELHTWQFIDPNTKAKQKLNTLMTKVNQAKVRFATEMGVPMVVVNDSHHAYPEEWENKELVWKFSVSGKKKGDDQDTGDDEYGQKADHLMGDQELYLWMGRHGIADSVVDEAIKNAEAIASRCHAEITKSLEMPRLSRSESEDLHMLMASVQRGFKQRVIDEGLPEEIYSARLDEEMALISSKGFAGYFNVEKDLVDVTVSGKWSPYVTAGEPYRPMLLGPGRGSAGGCLVAYLLGITAIDPIHYDLMFERFLDPDREDNPDIDLDFPQSLRPGAKDYLSARYGHDHVCTIQTLNRSQPKQTLKDVARALKVPLGDVLQMTKIIEQVKDIETEDGEDAATWEEVIEKKGGDLADWQRTYPELFTKIKEFQRVDSDEKGLVRQAGRHPSGVLISNKPLLGTIPTRMRNGLPDQITQFDMYEVEELGACKLDILGLRHLDTLMYARELIHKRHGVWLDFRNERTGTIGSVSFGRQQFSDPAIWPQIAAGHTVGIFQIETPDLTRHAMQLKPQNENDVAALISIVRPGVKDAGLGDVYLRRHIGVEPVIYDHPLMEEITKETLGVLVYQEQLMKTVKALAGFTPGEANALRRALGKKKMEAVLGYKSQFLSGCADNEIGVRAAEKIWKSIEAAGRYAFNKCTSGDVFVRLGGGGSDSNGTMTVGDMWRRLYDLDPPGLGQHGAPCRYGCDRPSIKKGRGQCGACEAWRRKFRSNHHKRGLRAWSLGDDGRLHPNRIMDVHQNGVQPVWRVTLEDGNSITTTSNHRHMTPDGWREVWELAAGDELLVCGEYEGQHYEPDRKRTTVGERGPRGHIDGGFVRLKEWTNGQEWACSWPDCDRSRDGGYRIERAHLDGNRTHNEPSNLAMLCASHHKSYDYQVNGRQKRGGKGYPTIPTRIVSVEPAGEEMTYDLEMADPYHSWVGNDIVTHNSHAVGYAIISTWEVWVKRHYPIEFLAALLATDDENTTRYVREARRMKFKILPPDINLSGRKFTLGPVGSGEIRYGLQAVRGVGDVGCRHIDRARPFASFPDYLRRAGKGADKTVAINLAMLGAFDSMGTRDEILHLLEEERAKEGLALSTLDNPIKLRDTIDRRLEARNSKYRIERPDFNDPEVMAQIELDLCGNCITIDPMADYLKIIDEVCIAEPEQITGFRRNEEFAIGGQLTQIKVHTIQKKGRNFGREMAFMTVQHNELDFEVTAFPDIWEESRELLKIGVPVIFYVKRDDRGCNLYRLDRLDLVRKSARAEE